MKTLRYTALMLCVVVLFSACQPTPEAPIIVNKNDGKLEETIHSDSAENSANEQIGADEGLKWEETFASTDGTTNIIVDAAIEVPETDTLPVVDCAPHTFTIEEVRGIVKEIYGDDPIYTNYKPNNGMWLKLTLVEQKRNLESLKTTGAYPPDTNYTFDDLEEEIKFVENQIRETEELIYGSDGEEKKADELEYRNENGSYALKLINDKEPKIYFYAAYQEESITSIVEHGVDGVSIDSLYKPLQKGEDIGIAISREEAEKIALDAIHSYGLADCMITSAHLAEIKYNSAPDQIRSGYGFKIARTIGGVPSIHIPEFIGTKAFGVDGAEYREPWRPEQIWVVVGEEGVLQVQWELPSKIIRTSNENVKILSWEEIKAIASKQLKHSLSVVSDSPWIEEGTVIRDATVERIVLNMMRVAKKDTIDEYYYLPVWDFIGSIKDTADEVTVESDFSTEISFLTLNAIDGSVIDRGLGY